MKGKLLKVVNPVFFLSMLIQVLSGLGQRYAGHEFFLFFRRVHVLNGVPLIALFFIHLYLNWTWIKGWLGATLFQTSPGD